MTPLTYRKWVGWCMVLGMTTVLIVLGWVPPIVLALWYRREASEWEDAYNDLAAGELVVLRMERDSSRQALTAALAESRNTIVDVVEALTRVPPPPVVPDSTPMSSSLIDDSASLGDQGFIADPTDDWDMGVRQMADYRADPSKAAAFEDDGA